jgi:Flp pilus assembly protein TadG
MGAMRDDRGSAPAEFVMVAVLLLSLVLGVVQLALYLHVKNTLQDAASEGARWAAMADSDPRRGIARTQELITSALTPGYASNVTASQVLWNGQPAAVITVAATVPLVGLIGVPGALEVSGHSALERVN